MVAAAAMVALGVSVAQAEPATVPLLLIDPPAGFDAARFATALETYVPSARVVVSVSARAGADPAAICAEVQAAAAGAGALIALWARWTDGGLVIERVGAAGCEAVDRSVVDVASEQQAFVYRVAALKVASLVRDLAEAAPVAEAAEPVAPPPEPDERGALAASDGDDVVRGGVVAAEPARVLELGASGIASTRAADRVTLASLGGWVGGAWRFGGTAMISDAHEQAGPGGQGRVRVFGGFAGTRRVLARGPWWRFEVTAELGVLHVRSEATRTGGAPAMSAQVWTPAAAVAPRLGLPLAGPLGLALGPTVEASTRAVRLTLGDTPLYNASRVRLRWDVRAELRF